MSTLIKEIQKHIETGVDSILAGYDYKNLSDAPRITAPAITLAGTLVYTSPKDSQSLLAQVNDTWEDILYLAFSNGLGPSPEAYSGIKAEFKSLNAKNRETYSDGCMPHVNKPHWILPEDKQAPRHEQGCCIYVGSCHENVKSRMEQHLKALSSSPIFYGLHLAEWWTGQSPVTFHVFTFKNPISLPYLHQIEDILWDAYRPLFGQKGAR